MPIHVDACPVKVMVKAGIMAGVENPGARHIRRACAAYKPADRMHNVVRGHSRADAIKQEM